MRWFLLLALLTLAAAPRADIERDLQLTATMVNRTPYLEFRLEIHNRSPDKSYLVVRPGDGSEDGWREPFVHYELQRYEQGSWQPLRPEPIQRCKRYDPKWEKDVVTLAPGAVVELGEWSRTLRGEIPAGSVRMRAIYQYRQGMTKGGTRGSTGPMGDTPEFQLTSNWLKL